MLAECVIDECAKIIESQVEKSGTFETVIPGLYLYRWESAQAIACDSGQIMVSFIVNGQKETMITGRRFLYRQGQCLLSGVAAPSSFHAVGSSPAHPFLAVSLRLDLQTLIDCAGQLNQSAPKKMVEDSIFTFDCPDDLGEAFLRLLRLLKDPQQAKFLGPLFVKEIHYRLFLLPCREELRSLMSNGTQSHAVLKAVSWMKENYAKAFKVEDIADMVHMSISAFHRQFKTVTGMSPLQFQKQIRLFEAQRLMINSQTNVSSAAYAVGYESPTQFIREYRRQFGLSPLKDIRQRQATA